jgi:hypothetical protein
MSLYDFKMKDKIPIDQLKDGYVYKLVARNASAGVFKEKGHGDQPSFEVARTKWGNTFIDEEIHYDADDRHGTALPYEEIGPLPSQFTRGDRAELVLYLSEVQKTVDDEYEKHLDEYFEERLKDEEPETETKG